MRTLLLLILFWASTVFAANDISKYPYIIDTAGATTIISTRVWVTGIRWVGATTAGHQAVIQDANGRVLWEAIAGTTNWDEESFIPMVWRDGFKVSTLTSGKLYIYTRETGGNQ